MARSREQRLRDTLEKLQSEVDVWIASANRRGDPYLIPLSFYWSGETIIVTTPRTSRTARNFLDTGRTRAAIGPTRDVVVIDARVEEMPIGQDVGLEDAYVRATDFDPRPWDAGYTFFRLIPDRRHGKAKTPRSSATET